MFSTTSSTHSNPARTRLAQNTMPIIRVHVFERHLREGRGDLTMKAISAAVLPQITLGLREDKLAWIALGAVRGQKHKPCVGGLQQCDQLVGNGVCAMHACIVQNEHVACSTGMLRGIRASSL